MPQPTSKPGQPGGHHGPTRPTYFPLDFSSTTNMPKPWSAQCPDITAALRQPTISVVTGLPSAVMKRAVSGSLSIAELGAISLAHHGRRISCSVSILGPVTSSSLAPGLSGGIIGRLPFPSLFCYDHTSKKQESTMSWQPSNDPVLGDPMSCD